jgi:hypothetical protein
MVSEMAMADIAALEERGLLLTPHEIIRLNAIALRAATGPRAADLTAAPRVGWAGDVAIRQPTVAAEIWLETEAARWFSGDTFDSATLYAYAHCDIPGFFQREALRTRQGAEAEIAAWNATLNATGEQLDAALRYAIFGGDPAEGESAATKHPAASSVLENLHGILADVVASGAGLSPEAWGAYTTSALCAILVKWRRNGGDPADHSDNLRAHAEYALTLAEIRRAAEERASKKGTDNG